MPESHEESEAKPQADASQPTPANVTLSLGSNVTARFADWVLHLDTHELSRGGKLQRLEAKQIAVLLELMRRAPNTTTHDDLLNSVWPGLVVGGNTIHQAIAALRRSLSDQARSPQYIATVARQGYRWIGPAVEVTAKNLQNPALKQAHQSLVTSPKHDLTSGSFNWRTVFATSTILLLVVAGYWWGERSDTREELVHFGNRPLWVAPFTASSSSTSSVKDLSERRSAFTNELLEMGSLNLVNEPEDAEFHIRGSLEQDENRTYTRLNLADHTEVRERWTHRFNDAPGDRGFTQAFLAATLAAQAANWFALERELLARDFADPVAVRAFTQGQLEWQAYALGVGGNPMVALAHLKESLRLQPDFWLSQSQLSILNANRLGPGATFVQHRQRTKNAIKRLLELRRIHGDYAKTMVWQGPVAIASQRQELNYDFAESMWEAAVAKGWSAGQANSEIAMLHAARGNLDKAIELYRAGRAGNSQLNASMADLGLGYTLIAAGRLEEAKGLLARVARSMQHDGAVPAYAQVLHIFVLQLLGDQDAIAVLETAWVEHGKDNPQVFAGVLAMGAKRELAESALAKLEERYQAGVSTNNWPGVLGYLFLGELDQALTWLERTIENREIRHVSHIKHADYLSPLREHPRFHTTLARLAEIESAPSEFKAIVDEHLRAMAASN